MVWKKAKRSKQVLALTAGLSLLAASVPVGAAAAVTAPNTSNKSPIQLEKLDRGLVAAAIPGGVFLSWRLMGNEVTGYSEKGLTGTDFAVYRDGVKIADVTDSTNFMDAGGTVANVYTVKAVKDGKETETSQEVSPWSQAYYDLPMRKPANGVTPAGEAYTYSINDVSVGDVDGDGEYEYFVKWDPSNSKDVSQKGYTGNVYIDCYKFDGTHLYRIDLGVNIRAGAHYTQFMVYDFDGDGKAEMMFKTAPGTKVIRYDSQGNVTSEKYITMPEEDLAAGYSNQDDYRMSARDYYNYLVKMFKGWHEHEEVVAGRWPSTLEEAFGMEKRYEYPLSQADAESLTDYFIDVYAPARSARNELRTFEGFILEGPEYLSVFDGATGGELQTIPYKPGRHDDGLMWGDYAMARIEPGNRVDRFLAGVAYLDGVQPYVVFARGYYTRTTLVSYKWNGKELQEHWFVDSGWTPMTNPFNDGPHGRDGTDPEFGTITTQGAHSLSVADVDGDGNHEIIYGGATIDHDGRLLYSSFDTMPPESASPGSWARLGHGDALHVADIDPNRPGLESFMVFEGGPWAPYGYALRDAKTGEVIYGGYTGRDTGRGMIGDVDPTKPGLETWAVGTWTASGERISTSAPGTNMNIKWKADMTTQIVNGSGNATPTIDDWTRGRQLTATGTRTNNGTKGNPSLVADVFGDWREELLVRTEDSSALRFYLSTEVTDRKLYTHMHDAQYRTGIAWQNTTYNQPSYPSFYFASDTDWSRIPVPVYQTPGGGQGNVAGGVLQAPASVTAGRTFQVTFGLQQVQEPVSAQDITITYDPEHVELAGSPVSLDESKFMVIDYDATLPGKVRIIGIHPGEQQAGAQYGNLLSLTFQAKAQAQQGSTQLAVSRLVAANSQGVETVLQGSSVQTTITVIDRSGLTALLDRVQGVLAEAVEGKRVGQYPVGSKALLEQAAANAKPTADNPDATQEEIEAASAALQGALDEFLAKVIQSVDGDFNNDSEVTIGDLVLLAKAYGKTSADTDWSSVAKFDLNGDGSIDLQDLVLQARKILNW